MLAIQLANQNTKKVEGMEKELLKHLILPREPATLTLDATVLRFLFEHAPRTYAYTGIQANTTAEHDRTNIQMESTLPLAANKCDKAALKVSAGPVGAGKLICSFWYHYINCSRNPGNIDVDNSKRPSRYHHHAEPGSKVQKVPKQFHKGSCGLELCPYTQEALKRKTQHVTRNSAITGGDRYNLHANRAGARSSVGAKAKKSRSLQPVLRQAKHDTKQKGQERKRKSMEEATETCFFWYHGECRRGSSCKLMHSLTQPPSFVQPHPNYMHYVPCNLDWCPGDHKIQHSAEAQHRKRKMIGEFVATRAEAGSAVAGLIGFGQENAAEAEAEDKKSEWFLNGFP